MKIKFTKTGFKFIITQVFLLSLLLVLVTNKTKAQCTYVTTENGKETKLSIPCDFPVLLNTNKPEQDRSNFNAELEKWYSNNPALKNVILTPMSHSGNN
jgi:hypothetical protein